MNIKLDYKKIVKLTGLPKEIVKEFITFEVNNKFVKKENIESLVLFLAFCRKIYDYKTVLREFYSKSDDPKVLKRKKNKFKTLLGLVADQNLVKAFKDAYSTNNKSGNKESSQA